MLGWIYATEKRTSSITCMVKDVGDSTSWGQASKFINWSYKEYNLPDTNPDRTTNWVYKGTSYLSSGQTDGGLLTATGLKPNTKYSIEADVRISADGGGSFPYYDTPLYGTATTTQGWAWSFPTTSGSPFALTSTEWLNFQIVINNARVTNINPSTHKKYDPYSFTTSLEYISKGKGFSSWIFLQAVNAIDQVSHNVAPQLKAVQKGDKIYGWYFDNLANALNSIM